MRILVCGDRNWTNYDIIRKELYKYPEGTVVIEGACRGADSIGGYIARQLGFGVAEYPAKWYEYGKRAGMIRNRQMLEEGKPDIVLAFHNNIKRSKGTKNMVEIAMAAGIPVHIFDEMREVTQGKPFI